MARRAQACRSAPCIVDPSNSMPRTHACCASDCRDAHWCDPAQTWLHHARCSQCSNRRATSRRGNRRPSSLSCRRVSVEGAIPRRSRNPCRWSSCPLILVDSRLAAANWPRLAVLEGVHGIAASSTPRLFMHTLRGFDVRVVNALRRRHVERDMREGVDGQQRAPTVLPGCMPNELRAQAGDLGIGGGQIRFGIGVM